MNGSFGNKRGGLECGNSSDGIAWVLLLFEMQETLRREAPKVLNDGDRDGSGRNHSESVWLEASWKRLALAR